MSDTYGTPPAGQPAEPEPTVPPGPAQPRRRPLPADVQTPWGWMELVVFLFFAIVTLLLSTMTMALGAMLFFHVKWTDIQTLAETSATFLSLRSAVWYVLLIAYLFTSIHLVRHLPFWKTIGWRNFKAGDIPQAAQYAMGAVGGMALAMVVELGSLALHTKAKLPIEALFRNRIGIYWLMGVGILLAPAVEETIFRGFLYPVLARSLGVEGGVVVTGVLFGMMHAPQLWGGWGQIGLMVVVGIVLTYARARTGTVLTSWLLHLGYNTFIFAGVFAATSGLHHLPAP